MMKLTAVKELKAEIERERFTLQTLKDVAIKPPIIDGLPKTKSNDSRVEKIVTSIDASERRLSRLEDELLSVSIEMTNEIFERLELNAAQVLFLRYVKCEQFKAISAAMHLSLSAIFKIHKRGVKQFCTAKSLQNMTF